MKSLAPFLVLVSPVVAFVGGFSPATRHAPSVGFLSAASDSADADFIKAELLKYLKKRNELNADGNKPTTIGGTKGNVVLEFVSGAPNKETVKETSNPLDYDELAKYGYSHLITPIMKAGGRPAMYRMLGMAEPAPVKKKASTGPSDIIFDRTGELTDPKRYTGLKLGQVMDDNAQAEALERALKEPASPLDQVESTQQTRRRNTSTIKPQWTAERLDELAQQQASARSFYEQDAAGRFASDLEETLDLTVEQRAFSILTAVSVSLSFGKSTLPFLTETMGLMDNRDQLTELLSTLQAPALALLATSIGSSVISALFAKERNRNTWIWVSKGLLGGPLTLSRLRELPPLMTAGELAAMEEERQET